MREEGKEKMDGKRAISTEQSGVVVLLVGAGHPLVMRKLELVSLVDQQAI